MIDNIMLTNIILTRLKNKNGFTMVEILMTLVVVSIIGIIITGSFVAGNQIKNKQDGIVEIQQNVRVALHFISREMKMAGYESDSHWNPGANKTTTQITTAPNGNQTSITFSYMLDSAQDLDNDGTIDNPIDINGDGILDNGQAATMSYSLIPVNPLDPTNNNLIRNVVVGPTNNTMAIASNINSITFSYFNDDGFGGRQWANIPANPTEASLPYTIAVGITIVTQSTRIDPKHPAAAELFTDPYTNIVFTEPTDQRRRHMASTIVYLRNL